MSTFPNDVYTVTNETYLQPDAQDNVSSSYDDVDLSVLLDFEAAQCEGEPDLVVELIDLFLEDVPLQLSAMKDCVLKADQSTLKRAAHNLKGSSANMGVNRIAVLCEELEQIDFSQSFQQFNIIFNDLEQTFARVRSIFLAERQNRI